MNPQEARELMDLIRWVRDRFDMAILLVEHNMKVVMGVCETVHVLDYGATIAVGPPAEIQRIRRSSRPTWGAHERGRSGNGPERVLEVRDLRVSYGAIEALKGISLYARTPERS